MDWQYFFIGVLVGAVAAYVRVKASPTAHTGQASGFGG